MAWLPLFAAMSFDGDGTIVSQSNRTLTPTNLIDPLARSAGQANVE